MYSQVINITAWFQNVLKLQHLRCLFWDPLMFIILAPVQRSQAHICTWMQIHSSL